MHALSLLATAAAMFVVYRAADRHPHPKVRLAIRVVNGSLALTMLILAATVLPRDIADMIRDRTYASEREAMHSNRVEADRAAKMIDALGSPEAFIDYIRATQATAKE